MMLVVSTQYMENYGSPGQSYWKQKGGSDYKVMNIPTDLDPDQILDQIAPRIEYKTSHSEEYIIGYTLRPDDWLSPFERSQLEYDGRISSPEPTLNYEELINV